MTDEQLLPPGSWSDLPQPPTRHNSFDTKVIFMAFHPLRGFLCPHIEFPTVSLRFTRPGFSRTPVHMWPARWTKKNTVLWRAAFAGYIAALFSTTDRFALTIGENPWYGMTPG
ncbi:hypothetical protein ABZ234_12895 [Nocardiopsis sp. NPDC006198]|uniref:hypothetical protein n=1 Tax=Nocardiopsis sp. NPDC006198 TaxID=3154472 RepID=UPI0033B43698